MLSMKYKKIFFYCRNNYSIKTVIEKINMTYNMRFNEYILKWLTILYAISFSKKYGKPRSKVVHSISE